MLFQFLVNANKATMNIHICFCKYIIFVSTMNIHICFCKYIIIVNDFWFVSGAYMPSIFFYKVSNLNFRSFFTEFFLIVQFWEFFIYSRYNFFMICKLFSQSVASLFILLTVSLKEQTLILMKLNLSNFSSIEVLLMLYI